MTTTARSSLQAATSDVSGRTTTNHNIHSSTIVTTTTASKKKLGQNLSKLTKPPAPPVPTGTKATASSRNGLLLLSTKRSSSTSTTTATSSNNNVTVPSSSSGGILSGKSAALTSSAAAVPAASYSNASSSSTSESLFQAALGKMEVQQQLQQQQHQQQQDAWGVAASSTDKLTLTTTNYVSHYPLLDDHSHQIAIKHDNKHPDPVLASQGRVSSPPLTHHNQAPFVEGEPSRFPHPAGGPRFEEARHFSDVNGRRHVDDYYRSRTLYEPVDNSSHQHGNHHPHGSTNSNNNASITRQSPTEEQLTSMRDRAETRKAEEEARLREQRERAGQKLRELEEKMARTADHKSSPAVVLEPLGGSSVAINGPTHQPSWQSPDRVQQRTLFDPNSMSYSALLGGSNPRGGGDEKPHQEEPHHVIAGSPPTRKSDVGHDNGNGVHHPSQPSGPVIHLSSYEDRDRGERGTTAGPRMLFDPKSGAMVAVPAREDTGRGRKERPKRIRNERETPTVMVLKKPEPPSSNSDYDSAATDKNQRRSSRNRKDDSWHQQKGGNKTRSDSVETPVRSENKKKIPSKSRKNSERTLPRTCGVLYARDEKKGNCYPVDGCNGDVWFGAYTVPGGPMKNPEGYTKFLDQSQSYHHEVSDDAAAVDDYLYDSEHYNSQQEDAPVALQTGFQIAEPSPAPKIIDWVKPNEKIELVTGVDDSPTLQATAREWAPSQAALAAAAAVAESNSTTVSIPAIAGLIPKTPTTASTIAVEDVQEEDDVPFLGLGFDPTETMDSVIQSPSVRSQKKSGFDVDLGALSLEPPLSATSRNIFAFGSSATWGDNGDSGWGDLNHGFLSSKFAKEGKEIVTAASFLSLSSSSADNKAWGGSAGVLGLGGMAALSGKSAETTGE